MDNQHKLITGYRDLSQEEIDLMNEIKAEGARLQELVQKVQSALPGYEGPASHNPHRWAAMASTDFQTALMYLTRAVAQPTSF